MQDEGIVLHAHVARAPLTHLSLAEVSKGSVFREETVAGMDALVAQPLTTVDTR